MECRQTLKGEKQEVVKHTEKCHGIQTDDGEYWQNGSVTISCDHCNRMMTISLFKTSCKRKIDHN